VGSTCCLVRKQRSSKRKTVWFDALNVMEQEVCYSLTAEVSAEGGLILEGSTKVQPTYHRNIFEALKFYRHLNGSRNI